MVPRLLGVALVRKGNNSDVKLTHDPPYGEEVTTHHHHHDDTVEGRRKPSPSWGIKRRGRQRRLTKLVLPSIYQLQMYLMGQYGRWSTVYLNTFFNLNH
jgi:hypothetical protein